MWVGVTPNSSLGKIQITVKSHEGFVGDAEGDAADSTTGTPHVLNHVRTNLESPSADPSDCPRFTQTWTKAENFNAGSETTFTNSIAAGQSYTSPGGGSAVTATKTRSCDVGPPA